MIDIKVLVYEDGSYFLIPSEFYKEGSSSNVSMEVNKKKPTKTLETKAPEDYFDNPKDYTVDLEAEEPTIYKKSS